MQKKLLEALALAENQPNLKVELTSEDLLRFSNSLIEQARIQSQEGLATQQKEEKYLTRAEAGRKLGVCDTTLWHWNKRQYLKAVKIGRKVMYKLSDVEQILNNYGC